MIQEMREQLAFILDVAQDDSLRLNDRCRPYRSQRGAVQATAFLERFHSAGQPRVVKWMWLLFGQ